MFKYVGMFLSSFKIFKEISLFIMMSVRVFFCVLCFKWKLVMLMLCLVNVFFIFLIMFGIFVFLNRSILFFGFILIWNLLILVSFKISSLNIVLFMLIVLLVVFRVKESMFL